jgi:hypothetical protein
MYSALNRSPVIEKDPTINKMRSDVFNAMETILAQEFPQEPPIKSPHEIQFVSFEDAIKELAAMKQNKFV